MIRGDKVPIAFAHAADSRGVGSMQVYKNRDGSPAVTASQPFS